MAEYIDRMKVRIAIIDTKWICDQDEDVAYDMIDSIPAADVVEVKHGRWIEIDGEVFECDMCHGIRTAYKYNYCQDCGAKMDEEADNEQH